MFSEATLKQGIYDWVSSVSGVTTIWYRPDAPRPRLPYITLDLGAISSVGRDYLTQVDNQGMASLYGNREVTLEITYYGDGGIEVMEKLRTGMDNPNITAQLASSGISFVGRLGEISDSTLLDSRWESRRILEVNLRYSNQGVTAPSKIELGIIEEVNAEAEYQDCSGALRIKQDINVNNN
jgi:hypothetical protein